MKHLIKAFKVMLILYNLAITGALMYQGAVSRRGPEDFVLFLFFIPIALYLVSILVPTRSSPIRNASLFLGLIAATILLTANLLGAKTATDYALTGLILPLTVFFWGSFLAKIFHRTAAPAKAKTQPRPSIAWEDLPKEALSTAPVTNQRPSVSSYQPTTIVPAQKVTEPSRRDFLKRAGGMGLGLLAWSVLNPGKAGAAFFGSVPGPGTVAIKDTANVKIDPAIKGYQSITRQYAISEIDDSSPAAYYGFIDKDGAWYILREDTTTNAYRYVRGTSGFPTAWTNRGTQSYNYFDITF